MRLFIAIEPPRELKQAIAEFIQQNKLRYPNCGHWTDPVNTHITLNFLGEINSALLSQLEQAITLAIKSQAGFNLSITGFAWKPSRPPRFGVLEIGANPDFSRLQSELRNALGQIGIKALNRPAHLTLVRIKTVLPKTPILTFNRYNFKINEIQLIQSTLTTNGPIYKRLKAFNLPFQGSIGQYRPNVAICLINSQNELLLVKHPLSRSNYWQMLQGGIEANEDTTTAVKRELKEELNVTALEILNIQERVHSYIWPEKTRAGGDLSKRPYIGQEQSLAVVKLKTDHNLIEPDPTEITALKWVSVNDFLSELQPVRRFLGRMALVEIKKQSLAN